MVTHSPLEPADPTPFPPWPWPGGALGTQGSRWPPGCWSRLRGHRGGLSHSAHPRSMDFHLPRRFLWCSGCHRRHVCFGPPVEAASLTLLRCNKYENQDFQVKLERENQALVSASRALLECYHINTSQHKEILFEQGQNPASPVLNEGQQHHKVHVGNSKVLRLSVLWHLGSFAVLWLNKIVGVMNWITLLWGNHRSWDQCNFNQILVCESHSNWVSFFLILCAINIR